MRSSATGRYCDYAHSGTDVVARSARRGRSAFTFTELLASMAMVALIALAVVAAICSAFIGGCKVTSQIRTGHVTKSMAQRKNLEDGAENYKKEHRGFYPGQETAAILDGGKYTGSQLLASAVYGFELGGSNPQPIGKYASYNDEYLVDIDGRANCLSDMFPPGKEKAFCYYPYRADGTTVATKFRWTDNQAHTPGTSAAALSSRVTDTRFGNRNDVYNEKRFLLIAPGVDRRYFTPDDIRNFNP